MDDDVARRLLQRVCSGDRAAFAQLYDGYKSVLYRYHSRMLRNPADAEEATNETMLQVWKSACKYRGDSTVNTWIYAIGTKVWLMTWRKQKGNVLRDADDIEDHTEELQSADPDVFERLSASERRARIEKCMSRLKPEWQECLYLAFFEEWPHAEIAALQKVPAARIKGRVFTALARIRECVANVLRDEGR